MKLTSIFLMILTIIAKFFGLFREKALAHFFGIGAMSDIFLVAFSLPLIFSNVLTGAIANSFIPVFNKANEDKGEDTANGFMSSAINYIGIFSAILSLLLIIFARPLVKLMAMGFVEESFETAVYFTRLAMVSVFFTSVFSVFKAYLQIKRNFFISVSHSILMNLILIFGLYYGNKTGNRNIIGVFIPLSFILQYIIFLPFIKKNGFTYSPKIEKNEYLNQAINSVVPIIISSSVIELNFLVSKSVASVLFSGAISALNYAYKLQSFITGIILTAIITVVYPQMAKSGAEGDMEGLDKTTRDALSMLSVLIIPAAIGLFVLAKPIVSLLFLGGEFTLSDVDITANVLRFYALATVGISAREVLSRVFYTVNENKTPLINSVEMVVINLVLSIVLSRFMGIEGLGLATGISFILGAVSIYFKCRKNITKVFNRSFLVNFLKILICAIVMGIVALVVYGFLSPIGSNKALIVSIFVAGLLYLGLIFIVKVDEVEEFKVIIKRFRK